MLRRQTHSTSIHSFADLIESKIRFADRSIDYEESVSYQKPVISTDGAVLDTRYQIIKLAERDLQKK